MRRSPPRKTAPYIRHPPKEKGRDGGTCRQIHEHGDREVAARAGGYLGDLLGVLPKGAHPTYNCDTVLVLPGPCHMGLIWCRTHP